MAMYILASSYSISNLTQLFILRNIMENGIMILSDKMKQIDRMSWG